MPIIGNADAKLEIGGVTARKLSNYLTSYDTLFLIDDSASMQGAVWNSVKTALIGLAHEASKFDGDGVSLRFFNSLHKCDNAKTLKDIKDTMDKVTPKGVAPIGDKLKTIMTELLGKLVGALRKSVDALYAVKPLNIIVLTSGEFTESAEHIIKTIHPVIQQIKHIKTPPNFQRYIGIEFVQLGESQEGSETLQELDDANVEDEVRRIEIPNMDERLTFEQDIIDTTRWTEDLSTHNLFKILLGAINKDIDEEEADYTQAPKPEPVSFPGANKPVYPEALRPNEKAFIIPHGCKALVSAKSNASLLQRVQLQLRTWAADGYSLVDMPGLTYFLEGSGEGCDLTNPNAPGKASRVITISTPGWLVIKTLHARPAGEGTQFFDSPNKLLSEEPTSTTTCYMVGAEDGGFGIKPDLDFDDTLIKIVVERVA